MITDIMRTFFFAACNFSSRVFESEFETGAASVVIAAKQGFTNRRRVGWIYGRDCRWD